MPRGCRWGGACRCVYVCLCVCVSVCVCVPDRAAVRCLGGVDGGELVDPEVAAGVGVPAVDGRARRPAAAASRLPRVGAAQHGERPRTWKHINKYIIIKTKIYIYIYIVKY